MASLNDFQTGSDASLEDFKPDANKVAPVSNDASNKNLAAHAVMFSDKPESVVANYHAINSEMSQEGKSALSEQLVSQIREGSFAKAKQSLLTILADPNVSDEQKKQAASAVYDANSSLYSVRNIVSTEAIAQPMTDEPHEVSEQRFNMANVVDSINAEKREQQILVNMNANTNNERWDQHLADMATSMVLGGVKTARVRQSLGDGGLMTWAQSLIPGLQGSSKEQLTELMGRVKPEDRLAFTQKVLDVVKDSAGIPLMDVTDYDKLDYARTIIEDGYYTDEKKWEDNVGGLLNAVGFFGVAKDTIKGIKGMKAAAANKAAYEAFVSKGSKFSVRTDVAPVSVAQNMKDVNPEKARALHEMVASDPTDEAAMAVYGASKDEAIANDLAPEIANTDGSVRNKVASPDAINNQTLTPDPEVADFVNTNGAIYYTQAEKANARANVVHDFQHAFDLTDRKEMFQVMHFEKADKSSGVRIKAVYGPQNGGYSNPLDAIELAKWGLRKHGIDDKNITLLKRVGSEYVPVDPKTIQPGPTPKGEAVDPFPKSKVKDVVYHGTNKIFDGPFDTSKSKDAGTWFTPNKAATRMYGDKAIPAKVNLENPYEAKVGDSRHTSIEKAMDGGHDGIIVRDENGEVSTISVFDNKNIHRLEKAPDPGFANVSSDAEIKDLHDKGHYHEVEIKGGKKIRLVGVNYPDDTSEVVAFDENGNQIGNVLFGTSDIRTDNPNVRVDPDWQRKGVASAMYDYAEKHGAKFPKADTQRNYRSKAGQSFRDARANRKDRLEFTGPSGGGNGDYLIQVDHDYDFNPGDISEWSNLEVKRNPFDRMAPITQGRAGSLNRHFFDIASMLDPTIVKGAFVQTDKAAGLEKRLLDLGDKFAKGFLNSKPYVQEKLMKAITEANTKSLDFDYVRLAADGFLPEDMNVLKSWRDYWDTHWYLENRDAAKTLKVKGYMQFIDHENETHLFARPIKRPQVKGSVKVYNPATGDIKFVKPDELDALYKNGGTVAHLRNPAHVGDDVAEFIVSAERAGGGYLRALQPDSPVLAYRKGYYHVQYKDPHFIIKNVKSESGKLLYQKAVATAPSIKEAKLMVNRLAATDGGDYFHRQDINTADYGRGDIDWDLHVTQGRSTQRLRGQRLEDATSNAIDPGYSHIVDPIESMVNSARSISRRASMRDMIEATKARFIKQYGDVLPEGNFGQKVLPGDRKKVAYQGDKAENKKLLADARSTYEYIRYLENGYINSVDDTVKAFFNNIANTLGNAGLARGEKVMHWMSKHGGPTGAGKKLAFTAYLALNPLRQVVIQGHQAMQLLALNPKWCVNGVGARQTAYILMRQAGLEHTPLMAKYVGNSDKELMDMYKAFERSGLVAAIDKQNLIRDNMLDAADMFNKKRWSGMSTGRKVLATPGKIGRGLRKIGFDAGENFNMTTAWLAHYDLAKRVGKNLSDPEVLDQITADARNYTYGMNSAGDQPYNQNALGLYLQFMQAGHKAILTMTTNRGLSRAQRARLIAMNFALYGIGGGTFYAYLSPYLPKNKDARDLITNGLEGTMINKSLSLATGEETRIDFSGLSPVNTYGMYDFIQSLFTTDVGTILASTPSAQLMFGRNARLTKFGRTAAAYFNLRDDYDNPVKFSTVAQDFAKISSGYSNWFKAAYAQKYHQKITSSGNVVDKGVSSAEAVAQAFGFQTLDESYHYAINDYLYSKSKAFDDDVKAWYKDYKEAVTRGGQTPEEIDNIQRTYTEAFRVWGNDSYRAKQLIERMMIQDMENGDDRMHKQVLQSMDYLTPQEFEGMVTDNPDMSAEEKQRAIELNRTIHEFKE